MSLYRDDLMCDSLVTRTKCCHFMFLQTQDTLTFFHFINMTVRQDGCQMKENDGTIWKLCITTTGYF